MNLDEIDQIIKYPNNTFCDEICCLCKEWFDACQTFIFIVVKNKKQVGYACYECGRKKNPKVKVVFT